jgi:hypothetical protein
MSFDRFSPTYSWTVIASAAWAISALIRLPQTATREHRIAANIVFMGPPTRLGPVDKPALASARPARPWWYETHVVIGVTS